MPPAQRRKLPRAVTRLLAFLTLVEVVLPIVLLIGCNRLLFFPAALPLPDDPVSHAAVPIRLVRVVRPDGRRLAAYDVVPRDAAAGVPVVLFLHGNAGTSRSALGSRSGSPASPASVS